MVEDLQGRTVIFSQGMLNLCRVGKNVCWVFLWVFSRHRFCDGSTSSKGKSAASPFNRKPSCHLNSHRLHTCRATRKMESLPAGVFSRLTLIGRLVSMMPSWDGSRDTHGVPVSSAARKLGVKKDPKLLSEAACFFHKGKSLIAEQKTN